MNKDEIEKITIEYGEGWAYSHVQRVRKLIDIIGRDSSYDRECMWYAAYLHDWGAFSRFRHKGIDHAYRSKEIAEEILRESSLFKCSIDNVLEAIENHDYRNTANVKSIEATLLREADFLDFLGIIGFARAFAEGPNDLRKCYERMDLRKEMVKERFTLPVARKIAFHRILRMEQMMAMFVEDSMGCY